MQKQSLCFWQQTYIYQMDTSCRLCRNIHPLYRCVSRWFLASLEYACQQETHSRESCVLDFGIPDDVLGILCFKKIGKVA